MILEFCQGGSLFNLVEKAAEGPKNVSKISENYILKITEDILKGLMYLHMSEPPIAHRDLKIENVLLSSEDGNFKLCDFGSCSTKQYFDINHRNMEDIKEDIEKNSTAIYRAPE